MNLSRSSLYLAEKKCVSACNYSAIGSVSFAIISYIINNRIFCEWVWVQPRRKSERRTRGGKREVKKSSGKASFIRGKSFIKFIYYSYFFHTRHIYPSSFFSQIIYSKLSFGIHDACLEDILVLILKYSKWCNKILIKIFL